MEKWEEGAQLVIAGATRSHNPIVYHDFAAIKDLATISEAWTCPTPQG